MFSQLDIPIKKEEDSDSNISGSVGDGDATMETTKEGSDRGQQHYVMTDHGQRCAASLLNMMMSVGAMVSASAIIASKPAEADLENNAMDLDLGLHGGESSHNMAMGRNNGFGEIDTGSPPLSPTASHVSRSISVEQDDEPPGNEMA